LEAKGYNRFTRFFFLIAGFLFLGLAWFGIITPGVPGIPFILMSAWFFLQSSQKMYDRMANGKVTGKVMTKYFTAGNVSKGAKWFVISQFWVSLIVAQILFVHRLNYAIMLNAAGIILSIVIYRLIK
jgi:uncharacterized membrane protein YbaN (DUF454 family)